MMLVMILAYNVNQIMNYKPRNALDIIKMILKFNLVNKVHTEVLQINLLNMYLVLIVIQVST